MTIYVKFGGDKISYLDIDDLGVSEKQLLKNCEESNAITCVMDWGDEQDGLKKWLVR